MFSLIVSSTGSNGFIKELLYLVVIGVVLGLIYYFVSIAPFVPDVFKKVLLWLILGFGILIIINFLLGLVGHPIVVLN